MGRGAGVYVLATPSERCCQGLFVVPSGRQGMGTPSERRAAERAAAAHAGGAAVGLQHSHGGGRTEGRSSTVKICLPVHISSGLITAGGGRSTRSAPSPR